MPFGISYYMIPIFSALVWLGTLLGMLIHWLVIGRPIYPSMSDGQTFAYISDVGAEVLKPLFIAGCATTVVTFDLVFLNDQWLRHRGRLAAATSKTAKILGAIASVCSVVGAAGLILLSIFDTLRHPNLHQIFLGVFIVGYLLTAIFVTAEYQRLGMHLREYRILRISFWIKLVWCLLFLGLAIAFLTLQRVSMYTNAAIVEWAIGFLFAVFVATFAIDFWPARHTKRDRFPTVREMEKGRHNGSSPGTYEHSTESVSSRQPVTQSQQPSRNF